MNRKSLNLSPKSLDTLFSSLSSPLSRDSRSQLVQAAFDELARLDAEEASQSSKMKFQPFLQRPTTRVQGHRIAPLVLLLSLPLLLWALKNHRP